MEVAARKFASQHSHDHQLSLSSRPTSTMGTVRWEPLALLRYGLGLFYSVSRSQGIAFRLDGSIVPNSLISCIHSSELG